MADVKITCRPNGPLLVSGPFELTDSLGQPVAFDPTKPAISLCRCGHSERKPFCDGSHNRCGWKESLATV